MIPTNLHMCRFIHAGKTEVGEYIQLDDGTGLGYVQGLNGEGKTYVVSYSDGTIPEDIENLELLEAPFSSDCDSISVLHKTISAEAKERIAKTNLILDEYKTGALDEYEAGAALFKHLFGAGDGGR